MNATESIVPLLTAVVDCRQTPEMKSVANTARLNYPIVTGTDSAIYRPTYACRRFTCRLSGNPVSILIVHKSSNNPAALFYFLLVQFHGFPVGTRNTAAVSVLVERKGFRVCFRFHECAQLAPHGESCPAPLVCLPHSSY